MPDLIDALRPARDFDARHYVAWRIGAADAGWLIPDFAAALLARNGAFARDTRGICLHDPCTIAARTALLDRITRSLADDGLLRGWRDEAYVLRARHSGHALCTIERAAARPFGVSTRAAHLVAFERRPSGVGIWVARRSHTKPIDPGMLDTLVGGGVGAGRGAWDTLIKEAYEEAGLSVDQVAGARAHGSLHIRHALPGGLHDERLHIYSLEVRSDFSPRNNDREVDSFARMPIDEVCARLAGREFTVDATAATCVLLAHLGVTEARACAPLLAALRVP